MMPFRYDEQREDLGDEFLREVRTTISRITSYPNRWPALTKTIRSCRTDRFPYWLIYEVHDDKVIIICVMHQSRDPGTENVERRNNVASALHNVKPPSAPPVSLSSPTTPRSASR